MPDRKVMTRFGIDSRQQALSRISHKLKALEGRGERTCTRILSCSPAQAQTSKDVVRNPGLFISQIFPITNFE